MSHVGIIRRLPDHACAWQRSYSLRPGVFLMIGQTNDGRLQAAGYGDAIMQPIQQTRLQSLLGPIFLSSKLKECESEGHGSTNRGCTPDWEKMTRRSLTPG